MSFTGANILFDKNNGVEYTNQIRHDGMVSNDKKSSLRIYHVATYLFSFGGIWLTYMFVSRFYNKTVKSNVTPRTKTLSLIISAMENRPTKTNPTIPHNLYVSFKPASSLLCALRLIQVS